MKRWGQNLSTTYDYRVALTGEDSQRVHSVGLVVNTVHLNDGQRMAVDRESEVWIAGDRH
jgi:hypothetical protein